MESLKRLNKEQLFTVYLLLVVGLDYIFLISSQATQEWYKGGDDGCEWKGSSDKVYNSDCYSHKSYQDTKCSDCDCCDTQVDLDKLGHQLWPFIVLLLSDTFWLAVLVFNLKKPLDLSGYFIKLSKILTVPIAFLCIIFFAVESFGITHEKVQAGLVMRVISIVLFGVLTLSLCWLTPSMRPKVKSSLLKPDVTPLSLFGNGSGLLVNKEDSLSKL